MNAPTSDTIVLRDTYLVQRFRGKPEGKEGLATRVFGGPMLQVRPVLWDLLQDFCDVEYMGAAEYEFGRLPSMLGEFNSAKSELVLFDFVLSPKEIAPNRRHEWAFKSARQDYLRECHKAGVKPKRAKKYVSPTVTPTTIFVVCHKSVVEPAKTRIRELAVRKWHVKAGDQFADHLDPDSYILSEPEHQRTQAWLEMDNGFFFTTKREMAESFLKLVSIEVPAG